MDKYNQLFTEMLDSSIWLEEPYTRIVWITFLAAMDKDGFCPFRSAAEVAIRARVEPAIAIAALKKFESPDPLAPEDENEGRRIERVPGGYIVHNAIKHREQVTREEVRRQNAERARRYREKKKASSNTVTPDRDAEETEGMDITTSKPSDENVIRHAPFTRSVSEAEAKQLQKQGREAADALAKETLQRAKARAKEPKALAGPSLFSPSVVASLPDVPIGPEPERDGSSLFPRRLGRASSSPPQLPSANTVAQPKRAPAVAPEIVYRFSSTSAYCPPTQRPPE